MCVCVCVCVCECVFECVCVWGGGGGGGVCVCACAHVHVCARACAGMCIYACMCACANVKKKSAINTEEDTTTAPIPTQTLSLSAGFPQPVPSLTDLSGSQGAVRALLGLFRHQMLLILGKVQLPDLLLDVLVEGLLPERQGAPHRVVLYTGVGKLDHPSAQFLKDTASTNETQITPGHNLFSSQAYSHQ